MRRSIAAILGVPTLLDGLVMLVTGFADAVMRRSADDEEFREAVRARWGKIGVIDLAPALQMGRMFQR